MHLRFVDNPTQISKDLEGRRTSSEELAITAETLLANCPKELQETMTTATEKHDKDQLALVNRLRLSKRIRLDDKEEL